MYTVWMDFDAREAKALGLQNNDSFQAEGEQARPEEVATRHGLPAS